MHESTVNVRAAIADDATAMHSMIQAMARETGSPDGVTSCAEDLRRFGFTGAPAFHALIAEREGKAIGMCVYFFSFSTWRGTRGVYVQDIYVAEAERGTGLARRLVAETALRAGEEGAEYLRLSVDSQNLAARKFYESIGLAHATGERIYMARGDAFDALKHLEGKV